MQCADNHFELACHRMKVTQDCPVRRRDAQLLIVVHCSLVGPHATALRMQRPALPSYYNPMGAAGGTAAAPPQQGGPPLPQGPPPGGPPPGYYPPPAGYAPMPQPGRQGPGQPYYAAQQQPPAGAVLPTSLLSLLCPPAQRGMLRRFYAVFETDFCAPR